MSYEMFCAHTRGRPDNARAHYDHYRHAHELQADERFFQKHADEEWFLEKYHPSASQLKAERRRSEAKEKVERLKEEKEMMTSWPSLCLGELVDNPLSPHKCPRLLSSNVPANVPLAALKSHFSSCDVIPRHVALSDVFVSEGNVCRNVWALFSSEDSRNKAMEALKDKPLVVSEAGISLSPLSLVADDCSSPVFLKPSLSLCPPISSTCERISLDVTQSLRLIEKVFSSEMLCSQTDISLELDSDVGVSENPLMALLATEENEERKLDLQVLYLRYVHLFCYYCGTQYETDTDMLRECGLLHHRLPLSETHKTEKEKETETETERKWAENLALRLASVLESPPKRTSVDEGERGEKEFLTQCMSPEVDGKCRCRATEDCKKLFKSDEFLLKHLRLKHADLLQEFVAKYKRNISFDTFRADPSKLSLSPSLFPKRKEMKADSFPLLPSPPPPSLPLPPLPSSYPPHIMAPLFHPPPSLPLPPHFAVGRGRPHPYPPNVNAIPFFHPVPPVCGDTFLLSLFLSYSLSCPSQLLPHPLPFAPSDSRVRPLYDPSPPHLRRSSDTRVPVDYSDL